MTTPRDDMNLVCRSACDFVFKYIKENEGFIPFAVLIDRDNETRLMMLGEDQIVDGGQQDLERIRNILRVRASNGDCTVTAVASDIRVQMDDTGEICNAIRVEVEHINDDPITCILPYRRNANAVEQHIAPYLQPGERVIFT